MTFNFTLSTVVVSIDDEGSQAHNSTSYDTELYRNETSLDGLSNSDKFSENLSLAIQAGMAFVRFIGNILTFMTLNRNSSMFTGTALRLLKNQAVADAIVCFLGSIFVLQPPMWKTELNETLDLLICQVRTLPFMNTLNFKFIFIYFYKYGLIYLCIVSHH